MKNQTQIFNKCEVPCLYSFPNYEWAYLQGKLKFLTEIPFFIYILYNNINGNFVLLTSQIIGPIFFFRPLGSTTIINKALIKYGHENFSLHIIASFDNIDDLNKAYSSYLTTLVPPYNMDK